MPLLEEFDAHYPVLASWMKGARSDHIWGYSLNADPHDPDALPEYQPIEATLRALQESNPARLDGKRREFRTVRTAAEFRGLQVELSFGAMLARHGIAFDFGAPGMPQPDFVLRHLELGIELTAKRADPLWDLKWHLHAELRDISPRLAVHLTFSAPPFSIRTKVRDALVEEIRRAAQDGEREVYCVVRPAGHGEPAITVRVLLSPSTWHRWPQIRVEGDGNAHRLLLADAERAIVAAMEDKRKKRQGQSMPTLLLVDVSDVKHVQTRSNAAWLQQFAQFLTRERVFVGFGIIHSPRWLDARVAICENSTADLQALHDLRSLGRALKLRVLTETELSP